MTAPVDALLVAELARLARKGTPAAEAWRLLAVTAARLGIPRPSYTTVLRIVNEERPIVSDDGPSVLDSLILGRVPTLRELEGTRARALERKRRKR
jgi:hypothetical protein